MVRILVVCFLLLVRSAWATCSSTVYPSDPVTVLGLQGRPIPNAQVTFAVYSTGVGTSVWVDSACNTVMTVVPSSGILQFYGTPGLYQATVSGQGITRIIYINVMPGSADPNNISISRSADSFMLFTDPGTLDEQAILDLDTYATLLYQDEKDRCAHLQFVLPTFPIKLRAATLVWRTLSNGDGTQKVAWQIVTCYSTSTNDFCAGGTTTYDVATVVSASSSVPQYLTILGGSLGGTVWPASSIIRVDVCREGTAVLDTWEDFSLVDLLRLEFDRQ